MTKEEFTTKMVQHEKTFNELWSKIVQDVNEFTEQNPNTTMYSLQKVDRIVDGLCLSGAWIEDRINGKSGNPHAKEYRGSRTKAVRKALGYTL
jgi:hypothetical protein